jgi:tryptophan 2,3-dioxygenase
VSESRPSGYPKKERTKEEVTIELDQAVEALKARYGDRAADYIEGGVVRKEITYDDYIQTPTLLSLQTTLTDYHDELIFKVYHQQTELWFRLALHEIERAIRSLLAVPADISNATDAISRVNRYFDLLSHSFSVLIDGLSSEEFLIYRKAFGTSSGFQSAQFRVIEILAGLERNAAANAPKPTGERARSENSAHEQAAFYWERAARHLTTNEPTLTLIKFKEKYIAHFDALYNDRNPNSLRLAFQLVVGERMHSKSTGSDLYESVLSEGSAADLIALAEELLRFDEGIIAWKQWHLRAAAKHLAKAPRGTGDTNWAEYLAKSIAEQRCFPELREAFKAIRPEAEQTDTTA